MLGELISESHGRIIGVRVLDEYGTIEQSGQQNGTLLGIDYTETATFTSAPRGDTMCGTVKKLESRWRRTAITSPLKQYWLALQKSRQCITVGRDTIVGILQSSRVLTLL